jgi:hypothetical protein
MQASQTPTLVPLAFAANGTKNVIPEASQIGVTPGAASLNDGFPPLTFTPIAAGGVPPAGADFNGVLNLITQTIRWVNAGGQFKYNSTFASDSNVGGYPAGAILSNAAGTGIWINAVDGNTSNPDTGGANWVAGFTSPLVVGAATASQHAVPLGQMSDAIGGVPTTGRLLNIQTFTTAGAFTYTPTAGATTAIADVQGAGGQGGGSAACSGTQNSFGTGGHSGSRAVVRFSLSGVTTLAGTVGAGGSTGAAGAAGQTGGTSSLGTLASCPGGPGGGVLGPTTTSFVGGNVSSLPSPSIAGVLQTLFNQPGNAGQSAICISVGVALSGTGGISPGYSGGIVGAAGTGAGAPGSQIGMGGSGAFTAASGAAQVGGAGSRGQVVVYEYA